MSFKRQINNLFIAGRILELIEFSLKFSCFHLIVRGKIDRVKHIRVNLNFFIWAQIFRDDGS